MKTQARAITTTQQGPHDKVVELVERYRQADYQRPASEHTVAAFEHISEWLDCGSGDIILDACCGVGESTAKIAQAFPDARVIGVDKSAARLSKHAHYSQDKSNYRVVRADIIDFWFLASQANWSCARQYILYPNPYPKPAQLKKRWHASASLPHIVALGGLLTLRSNWLIYLQEWQTALQCYNLASDIQLVDTSSPLTPFERKYADSEQRCWQLTSKL